MTYLFVDTTYDISMGILDSSLEWKSFNTYVGQKASSVIQKEAHHHLQQHSLKISSLSGIITIAGPGFYTGLRLSEGFADVLSFSGVRHYSLLSYSIPSLTNISSGTWMTKAYRGEYFFHHWGVEGAKEVLISQKELPQYMSSINQQLLFIHSESAIDDLLRGILTDKSTTLELIKNQPQVIFKQVLANSMRNESYYFRAPEDEFKVSL